MPEQTTDDAAPLQDLDHWEEFLQARYPQTADKSQEAFRDYLAPAVRPGVREFYPL